MLQLYCCICISFCWSDSGGLEGSMEKLQPAHAGVLLLPCQHSPIPAMPTFLSKGTHWLQKAVKNLGIKQMFASCFLPSFKLFLQTECKWLSVQVPPCGCELYPAFPSGDGVGCVWFSNQNPVLGDVPWATGQCCRFWVWEGAVVTQPWCCRCGRKWS